MAVAVAVVGTQLSRPVLDLISDAQFRSWSRNLIMAIASFYLVYGLVLRFAGGAAQAASAASVGI